MTQAPNSNASARLIYDGDCPFCTSYVRLVRLRDSIGPVAMINARSDPALVHELAARGYDLDQGMVLELDGATYFGDDCLNRLALLSTRSGVFNRLNALLFRSPRVTQWAYPVLKAGRNATLRLMGRRKITQE